MTDIKILELLLQACAVGLGFLIAWIFQKASKEMERLTDSVNDLNLKVAEIIQSVRLTEAQMLEHKKRIEEIERVI